MSKINQRVNYQRLSYEQFQKTLERQLEGLSEQQKVTFAKRCALYVLPYLYQKNNMSFWPADKRQKHIYAIFNVFDICHAYVISSQDSIRIDFDAARAAAAAAVDDAYDAVRAARAAGVYDAMLVARAAATGAVTVAASFAARAAVRVARAAYSFNQTDIQSFLFQKLKAISNDQTPTKVEFEQSLLDNFAQTLRNENCNYWADLYTKILTNNFNVDIRELEQRLNVPEEIKAQGAAAVGHYMEQLKIQGAELLNESRILILGDKGAGKTCLARRLIDPSAKMATLKDSTAGVDTTTWILDKSNTKVRIWDFAGHTVTHAVHQFFLSERCLYILVYDGRTEQSNRLEYWLDHMKNYGGDSQAVILVNEKDQHKVTIPINKLKEQYAIYDVYYLDIADSQQVDEFRRTMADLISTNPCWNNQQIPKGYYQVKADLEDLFEQSVEQGESNTKERIDFAEFEQIAKRHNIDEPKLLLKDLNALGVSLWYPELAEFNTLVLNPEWISHGVYQIINWVANSCGGGQGRYTVSLDDLQQVFNSKADVKRFGIEHHSFLFSLIEHYELAYQSQMTANTLIIPHLLNEDQPAADDMPSFIKGEDLVLEYQAKSPLPPHTISRFIVRHNEQIQQLNGQFLMWRTGVVLVDSQATDTIALVKFDFSWGLVITDSFQLLK